MAELTYKDQMDRQNTEKLRELLAPLPPYVKDFFRGIEYRTASRTRIAYAYDLTIFYTFLSTSSNCLQHKDILDISLSDLENLSAGDIYDYMDFLKLYKKNNDEKSNQERGVMRKLASLRSFYNYYLQLERIEKNPTTLVPLPKLHDKTIIRLDIDEIALLLDQVEGGENLTEKQKVYHEKTRVRDLALITLLLGTGIRVSECVGLNIQDVDFNNYCIKVVRKGGKEASVYFGDEVYEALLFYLEEREKIAAFPSDEHALFLSLQKKRLSVRSVEKLVKKYSMMVTTFKNITPHKLRSTFGTALYQETGDIYLVADALGHSDVNTTKKHYAAIDEDRRKRARNAVKLRED